MYRDIFYILICYVYVMYMDMYRDIDIGWLCISYVYGYRYWCVMYMLCIGYVYIMYRDMYRHMYTLCIGIEILIGYV